jgi:methionine-rich copper-binding protein CopC
MSSSGNKTFVTLLISAVMSGCVGNGNGLNSSGDPVTAGGGASGPLTADFNSIQDHVFTPICVPCHKGGTPPGGLSLEAPGSYKNLVGAKSSESTLLRIKASDPDNSYLIHKLENAPDIAFNPMPLTNCCLQPSVIAVIRQWISDGAQRGSEATSLEATIKATQRFAVSSTYPTDHSTLSESVSQMIVEFNDDIDSNLINETTVAVTRIDAPDRAVPITISTSIADGNPRAVLIQPQTPLESGTYQVSLQGSLTNMNAQALGSEHSFTFTVDVPR